MAFIASIGAAAMNQAVLTDYIIGLAHVGHVVESLADAIADFKRVYGVDEAQIEVIPPLPADGEVDEAPTRFAFVDVKGTQFELIEPISEFFKAQLLDMPSGLAGINHVAYLVNDIEAAYQHLLSQGIQAGHVTPDGIVDFGAKKMLYLDPATTGGLLIELIEEKVE